MPVGWSAAAFSAYHIAMEIKEFAAHSIIPGHVLFYLNRDGIIGNPLSPEELISLKFLEKIWGRRPVLRAQLSRLSMKARLSFLRTASLQTKWERYAYSRFRNLESGKKLAVQSLIEEIQTTFGFFLNTKQIKRLYTLRNRAQVAKHREKSMRKKGEDVSYNAQTNN